VKDLDSSLSPLHHLGAEIRLAREDAGMSQADLAAVTCNDRSYVSLVENGHIDPSGQFVNGCDRAFPGMRGWFTRFWQDARTWDQYPAWFKDWVEMEQRAAVIRWYEPLLIPGLVQTTDYALAVLSWGPNGADAENQVNLRMERQRILHRANPPELWVTLGESAIRRRVGSGELMCGQLKHLAELSHRPNVVVQIVPEDADAYGGLSGAFAMATVEPSDSVVYLETGLRGLTTQDPTMVRNAAQTFEYLRADALSTRQTQDLLAEVGEKWTA
jgi:transcriptional regulator with XRE-family HTH domain